jgi:hypothetical protein
MPFIGHLYINRKPCCRSMFRPLNEVGSSGGEAGGPQSGETTHQ